MFYQHWHADLLHITYSIQCTVHLVKNTQHSNKEKDHTVAWQCVHCCKGNTANQWEMAILGCQNSVTPEPIDWKFDTHDYVSELTSTGSPLPGSGIPRVRHSRGRALGLGLGLVRVRVRRTPGMVDPGNGGPESRRRRRVVHGRRP